MKYCSFSLYRFFILALFLLGGATSSKANDCSSAVTLNISPAAPAYTCASPATATFDACTQLYDYDVTTAGCTAPTTCSEDLWFQFDPSDVNVPTDQYNMTFEVSINISAFDEVRYYLLYSESKDSPNGNPCSWGGGNSNSQAFTQRASGCWIVAGGGGHNETFSVGGLDGSGTFFLVLERVFGTGGGADVCLKYDVTAASNTCNPPSNDRAANAIALSVGNGIDGQAATGGSGSWFGSISGTTKCATKQRLTNNCSTVNEDHFFDNSAGCRNDLAIGDSTFFLGTNIVFRCVGYKQLLDNSVFYTFQKPVSDPNDSWYLHIGNTSCANPGDSITVMIANQLDPSDASSTPIMGDFLLGTKMCDNVPVSGIYPSPDASFGPMTLSSGITYGIIVDGVHGAGCDFQMMLTRGAINSVLPVNFSFFNGTNKGGNNHLFWATDQEIDNDYFEIQRSEDAENFKAIGLIQAQGSLNATTEYQFSDNNAPLGKSYYRIKSVDFNGTQVLSEIIELNRLEDRLAISFLGPIPAIDLLRIDFFTPFEEKITLKVFDLTGKLIAQTSYRPALGNNSWAYSVGELAKGVYFIHLNQGKETLTRKVIKQ